MGLFFSPGHLSLQEPLRHHCSCYYIYYTYTYIYTHTRQGHRPSSKLELGGSAGTLPAQCCLLGPLLVGLWSQILDVPYTATM